jgi:hypothetical protein
LSFQTTDPVYPMQLSRSAKVPQRVDLYVLAGHRMDPTALPVAANPPTLEFAGQLDTSEVSPALRPYLAKGTFLTRWTNDFGQPDLITGDYVFTRAATDAPHQNVVYVTRHRGDVTGLALVGLAGVGAVALVIVLVVRRRRRAAA